MYNPEQKHNKSALILYNYCTVFICCFTTWWCKELFSFSWLFYIFLVLFIQ